MGNSKEQKQEVREVYLSVEVGIKKDVGSLQISMNNCRVAMLVKVF